MQPQPSCDTQEALWLLANYLVLVPALAGVRLGHVRSENGRSVHSVPCGHERNNLVAKMS
jgi:hypothetical protein